MDEQNAVETIVEREVTEPGDDTGKVRIYVTCGVPETTTSQTD